VFRIIAPQYFTQHIISRSLYCVRICSVEGTLSPPTLSTQVTEVRVADTLAIWYQSLLKNVSLTKCLPLQLK
ncbi:hypothetical protein WDU94_007901, partial [Cyamophila willieti]